MVFISQWLEKARVSLKIASQITINIMFSFHRKRQSKICRQISAVAITAITMIGGASAQLASVERADAGLSRRSAGEQLIAEQFAPVKESTTGMGSYAPPSTGDLDIGIQRLLKKSQSVTPFWFAADVNMFAMSNAFYTPQNEESDVFASVRVAVGARPKLAGNWYLDAMISQEFLRYNDFSELDYEVFDGGLGVVRLLPELWDMVAAAGYSFERVTLGDLGDDFFIRHSMQATLQKQFALTQFQRVVLAGTGCFDLDVDIDALTRNEYGLQVVYEYHFAGDWHARGFYNLLYRDYREIDRDDLAHILGAGISWRPKEWFQAEILASYTNNDSNIDALDYESGVIGLGAVLRATF